jgi:PIN domain nuclease of toxin-antitoxin system
MLSRRSTSNGGRTRHPAPRTAQDQKGATRVILLDTHVLLWLRQGGTRVGRKAAKRIDTALRDGALAVSAFSFLEIAMLVAAKRVGLRVTVDEFRSATMGAGVIEASVDGNIAILSTRLAGMHGDPVDRIIVATAIAHGATLVTADEKILAMRGGPQRTDAAV